LKTEGCLGMALIKVSNTWRREWGGSSGLSCRNPNALSAGLLMQRHTDAVESGKKVPKASAFG